MIVNLINNKTLLHWFLDDGSTSFRRFESNTKQVRLVLCSESFEKHQQELLCKKIHEKFGLHLRVRPCKGGFGWRIHACQKEVSDFFEIIGQCEVPSLSYKWK